MKNTNRFISRALAGALSLTVLCSGIAVASYSAGAESTGAAAAQKTEQKAETKNTQQTKKLSGLSKTETVYVIAKANGAPEKVIVSNWIKNPAGAKKIEDKSNLKNIENVKGDETYTINEKKMYEWDAQGNDIYYQGEGTAELPVGVNITYKLNDVTTDPSALAGKSGRVTIRFDYTNRKFETVKINGKDEKIYVPFIMLSGMLLDNEKFKNVEVTNGKVINDGNRTYVAGFAVPGMQESLGIDKKDFELPSFVEVSADATEFELATTLTVATNEVFSDLDSSKAEKKVTELEKAVDDLGSAAGKLADGTSELYGGLGTLLNKSGELVDGVERLCSGAEALKNGASQLSNGTVDLNNGVVKLDIEIGTLDNGAGQLNCGAGDL
jgi:putative membrane protein